MLRPLFALALLCGAAATTATAAPPSDAARHADCLALVGSRPAEAWESALAWESLGGGNPARHCGALALIALGHREEGALRLEALVQDGHASAPVRAGMLAQAAQAWFAAGQVQQALRDQGAALALTPDDVDLLLDRATTLGELGDLAAALADLDRAAQLAPKRADVFALRATAWRLHGQLSAAERDIVAALKLDPNQPDALLESGLTARARGNAAQARRAWLKLLQVAPDSSAAALARQNIEALDVRPDPH